MANEGVLRGLTLAMTIQNATGHVSGGGGGVVRDGLIVWYDGIDNPGKEQIVANKWWDLSGYGNHGTVYNGTWGDDELIFNGTNTWVSVGQMDFQALTIECLMAFDDDPDTWDQIACNYQNGGYGIMKYYGTYRWQVYKDNNYQAAIFGTPGTGRYDMVSGTVDSHVQIAYLNGQYSAETVYDSPISPPQDSTILALGVNPRGSSPDSPAEWFKGRIKSFRLYNRVLTADEIAQNYRYDKRHFGL